MLICDDESLYKDYLLIIGGDYGITCEEIDENSLSTYLNTLNHDIILTGDVGKSLSKKIDINFKTKNVI